MQQTFLLQTMPHTWKGQKKALIHIKIAGLQKTAVDCSAFSEYLQIHRTSLFSTENKPGT